VILFQFYPRSTWRKSKL